MVKKWFDLSYLVLRLLFCDKAFDDPKLSQQIWSWRSSNELQRKNTPLR